MAIKIPSLSFYARETTLVARELLGCRLVHVAEDGARISGRIVETEAYLGVTDKACHTFGNRKTERTKSMYLDGGHSYVYFIYGMHFCFNVVTRTSAEPEAVLIRALEPLEGLEYMRERRSVSRERDLASGPAKLCEALAIDRRLDGHRLDQLPLFIETDTTPRPQEIEAAPRVGVAYAGDAAFWPLRFFLRGNPHVSKTK